MKTIRIAVSAVLDGWKGCCLALKSFGLQKDFSQILFWESDASGTGGKVPARYGGTSGKELAI